MKQSTVYKIIIGLLILALAGWGLYLFKMYPVINGNIKEESNRQVEESSSVPDSLEVVRIDTVVLKDWVLKQSGGKLPDRILSEYIRGVMDTKYPLLLLAIAKVESHFDFLEVSRAKAVGPYQIRPKAWGKVLKERGIIDNNRDLFDPVKSSKACEFIIDSLYKVTPNLKLVLIQYLVGSLNHYKKHKTKLQGKAKLYYRDVLATLGDLYIISKSSATKEDSTDAIGSEEE